ncbi:hypothetical protein MHEC_10720 [Mycobacterium heckeshornense]|uniref:NlpC/P60 domain-containing protein n=1 Tax=Mycobacterium heckeshornense TaxID=110505 RepID=A0A7R7GRA4_9MYCO|nr:hypothetical protein MHEC_10720 [Mycobacterium heckeshornense]
MHQVFQIANNRAQTLHTLGDNLQTIQKMVLEHWQGEAGAAFQADMDKARADIETNGQESKQVAAAVGRAEADVRWCRSEAQRIKEVADSNLWTITPDWRVQIPDTARIGLDPIAVAAEQQALQTELDQLKVRAHAADHELATAIRASVGEIPLDEHGGQDSGQPRDVGSQERPGVTDVNDPGVKWQPGFNPDQWKKSWQNPLLADNPPGYTGGPGPARDQAWQNYLAHFPTDQRGYLPNPDAVSDPGLKMVGFGAAQLGTSYAWGGKGLNGPGKGTLSGDPVNPPGGAHIYRDDQRIGFDCSGLTEYAAAHARPGVDIGQGTSGQLGSPNLTSVAGGAPLKPGGLIYYGPGSAEHVGIYVAPGVILNAPESGLPVELDHRTTMPNGNLVRVRRLR